MAWFLLILAGLFEVVWAFYLKQSDGFTRLAPSLVTVSAMLASFVLLALSMRVLPLGTAYAIWTGIGAVGAFLVGIVALGEPAGTMQPRGGFAHRLGPRPDEAVDAGLKRSFASAAAQPIVWPVFAQSARNCSSPLSVSGCFTSAFSVAGGTVATSAPISAACLTWFTVRIEAARISVLKS